MGRVGGIAAVLIAMLLAAAPAGAAEGSYTTAGCSEPYPGPTPPWAASLPAPRETRISWRDAVIPSTDGVRIAARVYTPDAYHGRLPTVVMASPYWNNLAAYQREREQLGLPLEQANEVADLRGGGMCLPWYLLARGYAVVTADLRGTSDSNGCVDIGGPGDREDLRRVVEWSASQPFSTGRVGMYGVSYLAFAQIIAATGAPKGLKAIVPMATPSSFYRLIFSGGIRNDESNHGSLQYTALGLLKGPDAQGPPDPSCIDTSGEEDLPEAAATGYWGERELPLLAHRVRVPALFTQGTSDPSVAPGHFGVLWEMWRAAGRTSLGIVGPWGHMEPQVQLWYLTVLRWFEHQLRGNRTGMLREPHLRVQRADGVQLLDDLPKPTDGDALWLGNGRLSRTPSAGSASWHHASAASYEDDRDEAGAHLTYRSEPLAQPAPLLGIARLNLMAAFAATDGRLSARVSSIAPDGTATLLMRADLLASLRHSYGRPQPLVPGRPERFRLRFPFTSATVPAGHRIELTLQSAGEGMSPEPRDTTVTVDQRRSLLRLPRLDQPRATRVRRCRRRCARWIALPAGLDRIDARLDGKRLRLRTRGDRMSVRFELRRRGREPHRFELTARETRTGATLRRAEIWRR